MFLKLVFLIRFRLCNIYINYYRIYQKLFFFFCLLFFLLFDNILLNQRLNVIFHILLCLIELCLLFLMNCFYFLLCFLWECIYYNRNQMICFYCRFFFFESCFFRFLVWDNLDFYFLLWKKSILEIHLNQM